MIAAQVRVDNLMKLQVDKQYIEDYVNSNLADLITKEVMKTMTVTSKDDIVTDSTVYTATLPIPSSSIVGTSMGHNGTFTNNRVSGIITKVPELRVMEYTKNGKVTRVELQYYDGDTWVKVPRHTFEE